MDPKSVFLFLLFFILFPPTYHLLSLLPHLPTIFTYYVPYYLKHNVTYINTSDVMLRYKIHRNPMTPTWLWRDSERFRACIYCVFVYVYSSGVTQCYLNAKPSNKSKQIGQLEAVFFLQAHLLPSLAKPPDLAGFYTQKLVRTGHFARLLITWLAIKPRQWAANSVPPPRGWYGCEGVAGGRWCPVVSLW